MKKILMFLVLLIGMTALTGCQQDTLIDSYDTYSGPADEGPMTADDVMGMTIRHSEAFFDLVQLFGGDLDGTVDWGEGQRALPVDGLLAHRYDNGGGGSMSLQAEGVDTVVIHNLCSISDITVTFP